MSPLTSSRAKRGTWPGQRSSHSPTRSLASLGRKYWGLLPLLLSLLLTALVPSEATAQRRARSGSLIQGPIQAGLRGGRDFENDAWTLGAQIRVPLRQNFELRPSGDLLFPSDDGMGWQLNGDAAIPFGSGDVYAGGGIAFLHPDGGDTETGYNLFFGVSTSASLWKPFLEFRWTFVDETSPFRLMLGFNRQL